MNGSGTVQSSSAVGFETLYAGYRFNGTSPQMYYVRDNHGDSPRSGPLWTEESLEVPALLEVIPAEADLRRTEIRERFRGTAPQQLSARYDAWNRLVLITSGTQKILEHAYDARGYRIRKDTYTSGTLSEARHYY